MLTVPGCPNRQVALDRVRQALDTLGASQDLLTERIIDDPAVAAAAGMRGSPTLLVDGKDLFTAPEIDGSISCRLFPTAGGLEGAPSVEGLIAALSAPTQA